jgi:excisionase family DNA binding protein
MSTEIAEIVHAGRVAFGHTVDGGWFFAEQLRPHKRKKPLTVRQAAKLLGCSDRLVYALFQSGELRGNRIGSRGIRINRRSVREYQKRKANGPAIDSPAPSRVDPSAASTPLPKLRSAPGVHLPLPAALEARHEAP